MRAWIVGNGPSLKNTNLDLLEGETSFATNRIFKAFDTYKWRPDYYVRLESIHPNRAAERDDLRNIRHRCVMYLHRGLKMSVPWDTIHPQTVVELFHTCQHGYPYELEFHEHDWHLDQGIHSICNLGNSVTAAIQIAVVLGYGPLYLLGCDMGYVDGAENHFCDGYSDGYILRSAMDANRDALAAHEAAARCSPVPIYNATKGGVLEVYSRVRMEDVLYL